MSSNQESSGTAEKDTSTQSTQGQQPIGLLEAPSEEEARKLHMSGGQGSISLDHLGPMVINSDGTISRITNWAEMTDAERKNTLRVLGKRNMLRRETLEQQDGQDQKGEP